MVFQVSGMVMERNTCWFLARSSRGRNYPNEEVACNRAGTHNTTDLIHPPALERNLL